jgi:hypothetical protein
LTKTSLSPRFEDCFRRQTTPCGGGDGVFVGVLLVKGRGVAQRWHSSDIDEPRSAAMNVWPNPRTKDANMASSHRLHVYRLCRPTWKSHHQPFRFPPTFPTRILSLQVLFFRERLILLPFVIAIMSKDTSFRVCIAALLIVQIACWALALADLFIPGKPRLIIRTTMDVISQLFARRSAAMLQYRDFLAAF